MNLEHVALTITDPKEIRDFYHDILGMREIRSFILDENLACEIFAIKKETTVFYLQKEELILEIFLITNPSEKGFNHICISLTNREEILIKATHQGYNCIRLKRQNSDMIFIMDKSGNRFEIKQSH